MADAPASRPPKWGDFPWATVVAIGLVYALLATGFTLNFEQAPVERYDYFGLQAESILEGRLALPLTPEQARLDMSVVGDEVHLYWGLGNALGALALSVAGLGVSPALWTFLGAWVGVLLFALVCHRNAHGFPARRGELTMLFTLTLAAGTPVIAVTAWSLSMHSQSVAMSFAAQMAVLGSFLLWLDRPTVKRGLLLGLAMALAINTRLTALHLGVGLAVGAIILMRRDGIAWKEVARRAALPLALSTVGFGVMLLANAARFGHPLDTGMAHAVAMGGPLSEHALAPWFVSPRWVPLAGWSYLLRPPEFHGLLPAPSWMESVPVPWLPGETISLETHGALVMTPALLLLLALRPGPWSRDERAALPLALGALVPLIFLLHYYTITRRFTLDFIPALLLVAHLATVRHLRLRPHHVRWVFGALAVALLWAALAHWPLAIVGSRKVLAVLMLAEEASLSAIDRAPLVPIALLIGIAVDVLRFGRGRDAQPMP